MMLKKYINILHHTLLYSTLFFGIEQFFLIFSVPHPHIGSLLNPSFRPPSPSKFSVIIGRDYYGFLIRKQIFEIVTFYKMAEKLW